MGAVVTGAWTGGGGFMDAGNVLHRGGPGGAPLRVGFVCHVSADWEGAGRLSPSGDTSADRENATSEWGQDLGITSPVGGNGGGRNAGDRKLRRPPPEHFCEIYCNRTNYGPVSGIGAASRGAGSKEVVGAGEHWHVGDTGGGAGGRGGKGLRRAVRRGERGRDGKLRQGIL